MSKYGNGILLDDNDDDDDDLDGDSLQVWDYKLHNTYCYLSIMLAVVIILLYICEPSRAGT